MKIYAYIKKAFASMKVAIQRFPITIVITTLVSFLLMYLAHQGSNLDSNVLTQLQRITMVLALGIPLSLCIKRILEMKLSSIPLLFYAVGILLLVLYYLFFLKDLSQLSIIRYIAITLSLYIAFIFLPYGSTSSQDFELYTIRLGGRFFLTGIYAFILFLGLAGILFTIDKLLGIPFPSELYLDVWILSIGIFAPTFFLAGVPKTSLSKISFSYPHAFQVLLLYIVMPLLTIYTSILYIFFAKIILTHQWPEGLVAHLVLWYSMITTGVLFCIQSLRSKNKWVAIFYHWISRLILPILVIMFMSIGIRIHEYGITSNRYFVALAGIWVTGCMLYLTFTKKPKTIWLLISLSCLTFLSVWGPWSHKNISVISQNHRLEKILTQNNMLKGNKIIPSTTVSQKEQVEVSQILSYFDRMYSLQDVHYVPSDFTINQMEEIFGFPQQSPYAFSNNYFYYHAIGNPTIISIQDYDYFIGFQNYYSSTLSKNILNDVEVTYQPQEKVLTIIQNNKELYHTSLNKWGTQLYQKYGTDKTEITTQDMTFYDENENIKISFVLSDIHGEVMKNNEIIINDINFYILINIK